MREAKPLRILEPAGDRAVAAVRAVARPTQDQGDAGRLALAGLALLGVALASTALLRAVQREALPR